jgi:hypothetical protein
MKRVFPQIAYLESSIVKKERVHEKGFVIARVPSCHREKKKKFMRKAS